MNLFRIMINNLADYSSLFDGPQRCISVFSGTIDHIKKDIVVIQEVTPTLLKSIVGWNIFLMASLTKTEPLPGC